MPVNRIDMAIPFMISESHFALAAITAAVAAFAKMIGTRVFRAEDTNIK